MLEPQELTESLERVISDFNQLISQTSLTTSRLIDIIASANYNYNSNFVEFEELVFYMNDVIEILTKALIRTITLLQEVKEEQEENKNPE